MKIQLTIDDDVFEIYKQEAMERRIFPSEVIAERLKRAVGLDPRERTAILAGGTMRLLEERLGGGDIKSGEDLLKKVTALASIRFGAHEFVLTIGQYRELAFRAQKTNLTIEELVQRTYQKMQATFFEYTP